MLNRENYIKQKEEEQKRYRLDNEQQVIDTLKWLSEDFQRWNKPSEQELKRIAENYIKRKHEKTAVSRA